ncbi:MAG TPA: hypothetical protein VKZ53_06320 [Candidatus Angelobacter sp.]|nr:hypothetical protein [Candidatus Angelobacter sp.]
MAGIKSFSANRLRCLFPEKGEQASPSWRDAAREQGGSVQGDPSLTEEERAYVRHYLTYADQMLLPKRTQAGIASRENVVEIAGRRSSRDSKKAA